jgi:hypothetical protein
MTSNHQKDQKQNKESTELNYVQSSKPPAMEYQLSGFTSSVALDKLQSTTFDGDGHNENESFWCAVLNPDAFEFCNVQHHQAQYGSWLECVKKYVLNRVTEEDVKSPNEDNSPAEWFYWFGLSK